MPGLSGIPFLQEARLIRPEIQIVVLTMHQEFELIQQALRIGILAVSYTHLDVYKRQ